MTIHCPQCGSANVTKTTRDIYYVEEHYNDQGTTDYDVGDWIEMVGISSCTCRDCKFWQDGSHWKEWEK